MLIFIYIYSYTYPVYQLYNTINTPSELLLLVHDQVRESMTIREHGLDAKGTSTSFSAAAK